MRAWFRERPIPITEEPEQGMLYHYTSVEGLLGILDNRVIWVTKSDFLNDYSELIYLRQVYGSLLQRLKAARDEMYECRPFYRMLAGIMDTLDDPAWLQEQDLFVLSLTHRADSYTLWSNFNGHHGYNIQFDYPALLAAWRGAGVNPLCTGRIIYEEGRQTGILHSELQAVFRLCGRSAEAAEAVREEVLGRFKLYSIFFKDACFTEESEFRIVFTAGKDRVRFRLRNGAIIPYIEVPAGNRELSAIFDITIGPKLNIDIAEKGMAYYLTTKGYTAAKVKRSRIPLRY
ncbi:DUF2971 domain-containing protein [Paenibacillus sp. P26]|nr:DUF2971 domain-containing protein [Paenibacillus sp. P26]